MTTNIMPPWIRIRKDKVYRLRRDIFSPNLKSQSYLMMNPQGCVLLVLRKYQR